MSRYEKVDFLMYELQNGFRMALKPFNPPPPPTPLGGGGGGGGGSGRVLMITRGGFAEVSECSLQDCLLLSSCSTFEDIPGGGKGELKPLVGCSRVPSE